MTQAARLKVLEKENCESFNGKLRDELLNGEIFYTLKEAQILIEKWRRHYNTIRPHSSLGYVPPVPDAILSRAARLLYAPPRSANLGDHNRDPDPLNWSMLRAIFSGILNPTEGGCHEAEAVFGGADCLCVEAG